MLFTDTLPNFMLYLWSRLEVSNKQATRYSYHFLKGGVQYQGEEKRIWTYVAFDPHSLALVVWLWALWFLYWKAMKTTYLYSRYEFEPVCGLSFLDHCDIFLPRKDFRLQSFVCVVFPPMTVCPVVLYYSCTAHTFYKSWIILYIFVENC